MASPRHTHIYIYKFPSARGAQTCQPSPSFASYIPPSNGVSSMAMAADRLSCWWQVSDQCMRLFTEGWFQQGGASIGVAQLQDPRVVCRTHTLLHTHTYFYIFQDKRAPCLLARLLALDYPPPPPSICAVCSAHKPIQPFALYEQASNAHQCGSCRSQRKRTQSLWQARMLGK